MDRVDNNEMRGEQLKSDIATTTLKFAETVRNNPTYENKVGGSTMNNDPYMEVSMQAQQAVEAGDMDKAGVDLQKLRELVLIAEQPNSAEQLDYQLGEMLRGQLSEWQRSMETRLDERARYLQQCASEHPKNYGDKANWTKAEWAADLEKYLQEEKTVNYPNGGSVTASVREHLQMLLTTEPTRYQPKAPDGKPDYQFIARDLKSVVNTVRSLAPGTYR
ncbi:MAG: hypothetical protein AAB729_02915 [Patescibacteria group bacterium]